MRKPTQSLFILAFLMLFMLPACDSKSNKAKKAAPTKETVKKLVPKKETKSTDMFMVYFNDAAPYNWIKDGKLVGLSPDIMEEALHKRMGIKVIHQGYPWERAQQMVETNNADGFITYPAPHRKKYAVPSGRVYDFTINGFARKDNPKLKQMQAAKTLADLKPFKLGTYLGSKWAKANLEEKGFTVDWAPNAKLTMDKLVKGRFDIYLDGGILIRYKIAQLKLKDQLTELPNEMSKLPFTLLIGKKSSYHKILPKFNETIKKMQEDGTIEAIFKKYY